jgi:hypothetical protein
MTRVTASTEPNVKLFATAICALLGVDRAQPECDPTVGVAQWELPRAQGLRK